MKGLSKYLIPNTQYWLVLLLTTNILFQSCSKELGDAISFTNPLLPSGPDPWVVQKDGLYYFTSTATNAIEIRKTTSVSRLKNIVSKLVWLPTTNTPNAYNIWAPELHFIHGKWYLYYTAGRSATDFSTQRLFVLENENADPTIGLWTDKGKIADESNDYFSIDATVLQTDTANYLLWSSLDKSNTDKQCIYIARMLNPWTLASHRTMIASPTYNWEKGGLSASSGINEAPEILKSPEGNVFLIYSASACWTDHYGLGMLTLKKHGNPLLASDWIKYSNPVFSSAPLSNAFGPGHNTFFKSPDGTEDWIMYHANPQAGQQCFGNRSPRMQKFQWDNGLPVFKTPVSINLKIKRPSGETD